MLFQLVDKHLTGRKYHAAFTLDLDLNGHAQAPSRLVIKLAFVEAIRQDRQLTV